MADRIYSLCVCRSSYHPTRQWSVVPPRMMAVIQNVNQTKIQGQGFMQIHAGDSQPLTLSRPSSTPSTASLPPSIPYPMPNNTKLSGTAPLSGSGALSNGALPGYASITVGTAPPAIQTSSGYDPGAPRPASWSSEVLASQISASAWATNPGCTASWRSRVAANNGTVVTTQSWRYTAALNSTATTWLDVNHPVTGPTTTVFAPGAATYTIGDDDVCCGQCRIRYPLVRVYYWPVNSTNTWCMSLNPPTVAFSDGPATSSIVFAPPQSSNPLGLPTLTSSTNTMPTDLPKLPTLSPSGGDATVAGGLPTLSHSLDSATEVGLTGLPKLSSSFSSLNTATETVPAGLPKLTPRDISHVTPAPSLPSLPAELLRARSSIPLNHSQVYAVGPDGFILYGGIIIYIGRLAANRNTVPHLLYTWSSAPSLLGTSVIRKLAMSIHLSPFHLRKMNYQQLMEFPATPCPSTSPICHAPHQATRTIAQSPIP